MGESLQKYWGVKLQVTLIRKKITGRSPLRFWESMPVGIWSAHDHFILLTMQLVKCASLLEQISFSLGFENLRRKLFETLKERELSLWGALEARKQEGTFVLDLLKLFQFSSQYPLLFLPAPFLAVQGAIYSQNGGVSAPLNLANWISLLASCKARNSLATRLIASFRWI